MNLRTAWTLPALLAALVALSGCVSQKPRTTLPAPAEFSEAERPNSQDYTVRGLEPTWINPLESAKRLIFKKDSAKSGSTSGDGSFAMAQLLEQRGETEKAIVMYRDLLARTPHDSRVLHRLGVLYAKDDRYQVARAFLEKAAEYDSDNPAILSELGYAYFRCQRFTEAERVLRQSLRHAPADATARNNLALVLCVQGDTERALAEFKRTGSEAEAHASLGFVLSQSGQQQLARQHFRQAIALDPRLESTIAVLGSGQDTVDGERADGRSEGPAAATDQPKPDTTEIVRSAEDESQAVGKHSQAETAHARRDTSSATTPQVQDSEAPALATRVRRPPPDPAPVPPPFTPTDAPPSAKAEPKESVPTAAPSSTKRPTRFSLSPANVIRRRTTLTTVEAVSAKPIISKPLAESGLGADAADEVARLGIEASQETAAAEPKIAGPGKRPTSPQVARSGEQPSAELIAVGPSQSEAGGQVAERPMLPQPAAAGPVKSKPRTSLVNTGPEISTEAKPPLNKDQQLAVGNALPGAKIVSPAQAAWRPAKPSLDHSTASPAFFNPKARSAAKEVAKETTATSDSLERTADVQPTGQEWKSSSPAGREAVAPVATAGTQEVALQEDENDKESLPAKLAEVVTPDGAGWTPAGRATVAEKSPPPFFNPTTAAETEKPGKTPAKSPPTADTAEVAKPGLAIAVSESVKPTSDKLAPVVSANPQRARHPAASFAANQTLSATHQQMPSADDVVSDSARQPRSWLTAYQALVREAETVTLEPNDQKSETADEASDAVPSLAPIVSPPSTKAGRGQ